MPQETAASYANVQEMAEQLRLSATAYRRAIEIAQLTPRHDRLLRQIDRFLIAIGALLIVVGIAIFFAWNWADLGPSAKFGLIEGGIVVAVVLAWRFGLDSVAGTASLFAAGFLTGTFLAVFGQVYQTGADLWMANRCSSGYRQLVQPAAMRFPLELVEVSKATSGFSRGF